MKQELKKKLQQSLNGYSSHSKNWESDDGDTFLTYATRDFIERNLLLLTQKQRGELIEADKRFLRYGEVTPSNAPDFEDLQLIVALIVKGGELHREAA